MRTRPGFWIHFTTFTSLATAALFSTAARAADLGLEPLPPLTAESWTGFSFAVGGGLGILTADVNGRASRDDRFCVEGAGNGNGECNPVFIPHPDVFISQSHQLNVQDLSDDGIFGTIQAAYDWQFASRWVGGLFVDADLYDIDGHAKQRSSVSTGELDFVDGDPINNNFDPTPGNATLAAKVGIDWSISVGGRFGYLATPDTLLYVLGAYTHAELQNTSFEVNISDPAHPTTLSPINTHYLFKLANDVDGFSAGVGSEVRLGGGWSLKGEYRFTWLDGEARRASSETFQCTTNDCDNNVNTDVGRRVRDNAAIDMDFDLHTVRGMLAYRF